MPTPTRRITLIALLLAVSFFCRAQDDEKSETIFLVRSEPGDKQAPEFLFGQLSLSVPVRANPYSDEIQEDYAARGEEYQPSVLDYIIPDGLSAHIGFGVHYKSWVGLSANTGIDWIATEKLVYAQFMAVLSLPRRFGKKPTYICRQD